MNPVAPDRRFAIDLIRMADHIAAQFDHRPPPAAAESVAAHLRQFWTAAMTAGLAGAVAEDEVEVHPAVRRAVRLLGDTA